MSFFSRFFFTNFYHFGVHFNDGYMAVAVLNFHIDFMVHFNEAHMQKKTK